MPNPAQTTKILVITSKDEIETSIHTALVNENDYELLENRYIKEGVIQAVQFLVPDIILLDYEFYEGETLFDTIDEIAVKFPASAIIVFIPEEEIRHSNRVMLAGARSFLTLPFSQINLMTTLRRIRELNARKVVSNAQVFSSPAVTRRTIVVFSPKGGVGSSTLAINMAIALYQECKQEVLLVDGKHLFGDLAIMLNLRSGNSIADLISHTGTLDETLIKQVVLKHVSGIKVLPSPFSISVAQGIRPDDLYKVILGLQKVFSNIIIDAGNYLNDIAVTYMDSAFRVIVPVTPDLAALRNARQFLDVCRSLSYPQDKVLILLNKAGRKTDIGSNEIEKVLHTKVFGVIPTDDQIVQASLNEGVPLILKKSNHPISKAVKKVTNQILSSFNTAAAAPVTHSTENASEVLSKSSRLG